MKPFVYAHATHPQWQFAAALVLAQLRAQLASRSSPPSPSVPLPPLTTQQAAAVLPAREPDRCPSLALLYITDHYANVAKHILDHLSAELPEVTDWSGAVGVGIASNNVEYFDEPALAVMLCDVPSDQYRVFSGVAPLGLAFEAHTALIHAEPATPDLQELIGEMAARTASGYLFGGLVSSRAQSVQIAVGGNGNISGHGAASGVFSGGLSGVAFAESVALISRVTQGCVPLGGVRKVTAAQGNVVTELDHEHALDVMLRDLGVSLDFPDQALMAVRATLVGLQRETPGDARPAVARTGNFGPDVIVRHIIGLDPARKGIAVADQLEVGMSLAFCRRSVQAARADLTRICAEIREELEPEEIMQSPAMVAIAGVAENESLAPPMRYIAGAIYVSCSGRAGPHFGAPSAEMQIVRKALGDVPLVGFFAAGEIARHHLYGYTGVLTVFVGER